ncbi:MAG: hypothetical protein ACLGHN_01880 [Bacteriovoracia bacterium]
MTDSHLFFLKSETSILEKVFESFQDEFDQLLEDNFTDEELEVFEKKLDSLGAVYVQSLSSELSLDDFYASQEEEEAQREFFGECKSMITIENLPYLETNPFQVTYLQELLKKFDEVLIDKGGINELSFKEEYLSYLEGFKNIDPLISAARPVPVVIKTSKPVDPIEFLILHVGNELKRLEGVSLPLQELPEKIRKIYDVMISEEERDASYLLLKTGLNAKDFDDGLERLKFWLKKH